LLKKHINYFYIKLKFITFALCLTKIIKMKNYILTNKLTGVKELLNYADLQNRIKRNRKDFFKTYFVEVQTKTPLIEKILLTLFVGVSSIALGALFLEGFIYFI